MTSRPRHSFARSVVDHIPPIMRWLRSEVRKSLDHDITLVQMRVLFFIDAQEHQDGKPLNNKEVASLLEVSVPCISRMIDALAKKGMVTRKSRGTDRRHLELRLTSRGRKTLSRSVNALTLAVSDRLKDLSAVEQQNIVSALMLLRNALFKTSTKD